MCGLTKVHAASKTPTEYAYYVCQFNPRTPSHVAAARDHPRTVQVREDFIKAEVFGGLSAYALAPGREQRLAELIPHTATARQAQHDRQANALAKPLKRLTARQENLMRELDESFDMADEAGEAYRRRIRADYATLHTERKDIEAQLTDLAADATPAPAPDLVSLLPEVTADLAALPPGLQAELFEVFDIQIIWNAPMRQATIRATITDTTPAIVTALLARAGDDPATQAAATPATSADTSPAPLQGSIHIPILTKTLPARAGDRGSPPPGCSRRPVSPPPGWSRRASALRAGTASAARIGRSRQSHHVILNCSLAEISLSSGVWQATVTGGGC